MTTSCPVSQACDPPPLADDPVPLPPPPNLLQESERRYLLCKWRRVVDDVAVATAVTAAGAAHPLAPYLTRRVCEGMSLPVVTFGAPRELQSRPKRGDAAWIRGGGRR
jgi:hypothetical protein